MLRRNHARHRYQRGLSIIELMVALALSLLLIAGVIQIFVASKMTYNIQEGLARVQENGRFALELIKPDIRMAGLRTVCAGEFPPLQVHLNLGNADIANIFNISNGTFGWEFQNTGDGQTYTVSTLNPSGVAFSSWIGGLTAALQNKVIPGTDVLLVKRIQPIPGLTAQGNTPANATALNLNRAHQTAQDSIILVSDCTYADLFQNRSASNANAFSRGVGAGKPPGNISGNWSTQYDDRMQVYQVMISAYYIGRGASGEPSLFRLDFGTAGAAPTAADHQELVEGIENMQILYGVGNASGITNYVTADNVVDWNAVMSVRVALLARSSEQVQTSIDNRSFALNTTTVKPIPDRRYRQVFSTTIALRNAVEVR